MSISITGPEKYDLQDLVCAEIALRFEVSHGSAMILEPLDGEDAELTLKSSGKARKVEVQVKGSSHLVTLTTIAECLAHFPERKFEGCLFERLLSDDRIVLLVMSGRCDYAAAHYVVDDNWRIEQSRKQSLTRKQAKALLDGFSRMPPKRSRQTKLLLARQTTCHEIAVTTAPDIVRTAARRLFVVELAVDSVVRSRCEEHLRTRYRIPGDRTAIVLGEVIRALKRAKTQRVDAMPLVREVILQNTVPPLRPDHYVERGAEPNWVADLSSSRLI